MGFAKGHTTNQGHTRHEHSIFPSEWKIEKQEKRTIFTSPEGQQFREFTKAEEHLRRREAEKQKEKEREIKELEESKPHHRLIQSQVRGPPATCLEERTFVGEVSQFQKMLDEINGSRKCSTEGCTGVIIISEQRSKGLGGAVEIEMVCNGPCRKVTMFNSSSEMEGSRRLSVPTQLLLAHLLNGSLHSGYQKGMGAVIGDSVVSAETWSNFISWLGPIVKKLLDKQCALVKEDMKAVGETEFGSWCSRNSSTG